LVAYFAYYWHLSIETNDFSRLFHAAINHETLMFNENANVNRRPVLEGLLELQKSCDNNNTNRIRLI